MHSVHVYDLGYAPYQPVWDLQAAIQQRLIDEKRDKGNRGPEDTSCHSSEVLLFVEHPHIYTLGKNGDKSHLMEDGAQSADIEAEFVEIDRGGDITYHGPGQIVGYPILDMDRHFTDIHKYLRCLEEVVIRTCADYDVEAGRIDGLTGVWVNDQKVCAMGIKCSRWVTMHGFALNLNADLSYFDHIVPCGITEKEVTSLQQLLGRTVDLAQAKRRLSHHFGTVFGVNVSNVDSFPELDHQFSYLKNTTASPTSFPTH